MVSSLLATTFFALAATSQASTPQTTLTTCTNLVTHVQLALKATQKGCPSLQAPAIWHMVSADTALPTGAGFTSIRICTSKRPQFTYQYIRTECPAYTVSTSYSRAITTPVTPSILSSSAVGYAMAELNLTRPAASDSPIAYYLVKNLTTGVTTQVSANGLAQLYISGLSPTTSYSFTVTGVSIDGTTNASSASQMVTTGAVPVVVVAPAIPAFTLTASSETVDVNTVATGFTVNSTGGTIASFAISPAPPAGMSFSTSTGVFNGTPTAIAGATTYTITATNASGTATQAFIFTVTAHVYAIGDTGPGGGKIFYYLEAGFNCGATYIATGSPTGGLCHYLEVAPSGWNTGSDPTKLWAVTANQNSAVPGITDDAFAYNNSLAIGLGYKNSLAIVAQVNDTTTAAGAARAYNGGSLNDWYLPTTAELNQLCKWARGVAWTSDATVCTGGTDNGGFVANYYWSSSEYSKSVAWAQGLDFYNGDQGNGWKGNPGYVRPVRAF